MEFVVVKLTTGHIVKTYSALPTAKAVATRWNNQLGGEYYGWAPKAQRDPSKTKVVKNLMSGALVEIPEDTPHCCDPSSESFWSM